MCWFGRAPSALVRLQPAARVGLAPAPRNEEFNDIVDVHVGHVNVRGKFLLLSLLYILMYPRLAGVQDLPPLEPCSVSQQDLFFLFVFIRTGRVEGMERKV